MTCLVDGCVKPHSSKGLCYGHYRRLRLYGNPLAGAGRGNYTRHKQDVNERFWAKVQRRGDQECWEWLSARHVRGYGLFQLDGTVVRAHRVAYGLLVGPIPAGLVLDHLCRNPPCVNPAHLEPVSQGENLRRARQQSS